MHIEHQMVADAAMVALRPRKDCRVKRIYAYEVMSETDWNIPNQQNAFIPNVFEDVSYIIEKKFEAMRAYASQCHDFPEARSIKALQALATHRGTLVGMRAAEAFMLIRELKEGD